jgi:hypothetical protein
VADDHETTAGEVRAQTEANLEEALSGAELAVAEERYVDALGHLGLAVEQARRTSDQGKLDRILELVETVLKRAGDDLGPQAEEVYDEASAALAALRINGD